MKMSNSPLPFLGILVLIFLFISLGEWKINQTRQQPAVVEVKKETPPADIVLETETPFIP